MSGYQYAQGGGQWQPQDPHQQHSQYHYQQPNNVQQHAYQHPNNHPHHDYYAAQASQVAYTHNANASAGGNIGGGLSWSEAFPTSGQAAPQPVYYEGSYPEPPTYHPAPPAPTPYRTHEYTPHQAHFRPTYSAPSYAHPQPVQAVDDGEADVSDDMYEPEESSGPAEYSRGETALSPSPPSEREETVEVFQRPPTPDLPSTALAKAAAGMPSREASVIDEQDDAFYDDEEPGEVRPADHDDDDRMDDSAAVANESRPSPSKAPASEPVQEQAGPYSPQLSPGEVGDDDYEPSPSAGPMTDVPPPTGTPDTTREASNDLRFASVGEGKKAAQKAILKLIGHGFSYQSIIDEQIDKGIVKALFVELGLKVGTPEADKSTPEASPVVQHPVQAQEPASETAASTPPAAEDTHSSKQEERKDRIARLLALKASKPTPPPVPASGVASLPPKPPTAESAKTGKALLLQKKLEALRKAQEQRASTAAAATTPPAAPVLRGAASLPPRPVVVVPTSDTARKRPVAIDHHDHASAGSHARKRPYGHTRQESSLVVDVSDDQGHHNGTGRSKGGENGQDGEEDDDDVEMEIESQADDDADPPSQPAASKTVPAPAPAPAPAPTPAPPTAPASMMELERKMREIELMRRKIAKAELEAEKRSSMSTGQSTPALVSSPGLAIRRIGANGEMQSAGSPVGGSSIRVAKRGESRPPINTAVSRATSAKLERGRAASAQLPRVEASLQEKMFKLRLLQDKVNALQVEINAGVAEKRRLTEDIEEMEAEAKTGSVSETSETSTPASAGLPTIDAPAQAPRPSIETVHASDAARPSLPDVQNSASNAAPIATPVAGAQDPPSASAVEEEDGGAPSAASSPPYEPTAEPTADSAVEADNGNEDSDVDMAGMSESEEGEVSGGEEDTTNGHIGGEVLDIVDVEAAGSTAALVEDVPVTETGAAAAAVSAGSAEGAKAVQAAAPVPRKAKGSSGSMFTAYESPLACFQSYRFHPEYRARVAGGLRSLTYSGKIQENIELCPTETDGQNCLDGHCRFQHFASFAPQDAQILVELGCSDEYAGDQRLRFVEGLKAVLKQVRESKERDFDKIADAIIEFRRTFLGDPSRILSNLEGTTI